EGPHPEDRPHGSQSRGYAAAEHGAERGEHKTRGQGRADCRQPLSIAAGELVRHQRADHADREAIDCIRDRQSPELEVLVSGQGVGVAGWCEGRDGWGDAVSSVIARTMIANSEAATGMEKRSW